MGLLDEMKDKVVGGIADKVGGGENAGLTEGLMGMLGGSGEGLTSLVSSFKSNGLGDTVSSWMEGKSAAISPEQIQKVFGNEKIQELASKAGLDSQAVSQKLTQLLPSIIQKLSGGGLASGLLGCLW